MRHHPRRRLGVLATATLLTTTTLLGSPAQAASSPSADRAVAWLAGELEGGLMPNGFGGSDTGLTIDTALLASATGDEATAALVRSTLAPRVLDYVTDAQYGFPGSVYANETAKMLALFTQPGAYPRDVGGVDLVARLEALTSHGRIASQEDATTENLIGQAFAVRGLTASGSAEAPAARDYLAGLQCADGSFSLTMPAPGAAPACTTDGASTDATAFALSALTDAPGTAPAVLTRSAEWLASTAETDGSYGSDASIRTPNANSTGLAAAALGDACRVPAARRAATWVRSVQLTTGVDAGAIAYDRSAYMGAEAAGIDDVLRDQFRRSTAQAGLGLVWEAAAPSTLQLSHADGTLTITGARPGQTVCLTTPTGTTRLTGTAAALDVPVAAPATGSTTYAATTGPGQATLTLVAAPSSSAPSTSAPAVKPVAKPVVRLGGKRLVRGERQRVRVAGLRAGQRVLVTLRGRTVAVDEAGSAGRLALRFRVRARTGPATLKVTTRPDRTEVRTTVRVVRGPDWETGRR